MDITYDDDDDKEKGYSWSNLVVELLETIVKQLSFIDQLSFRSVCKSWCSVYKMPPQIPWLMIFDDTNMHSWNSCKLFDPKFKTTYTVDMTSIKETKKIKNLNTMKVHESKYGWLLVSSQYRQIFYTSEQLLLFTPFRNHNNFIELPTSNFSKSFEYATFSSDPSEEGCLFLTVKRVIKNNTLCIKTCRRGDKSWITHIYKCDFLVYTIKRWTFSEGNLYYVSYDGIVGTKVGTLDITRKIWGVLPDLPNMFEFSFVDDIHMVKSGGVLFVLLRGHSCSLHKIWRLYGTYLMVDLSLINWKVKVQRPNPLSLGERITFFLGMGYKSVIKIFSEDGEDEMVCHGSSTLLDDDPFWMSYECCASTSIKYYGPVAAEHFRKLLIDPLHSLLSSATQNVEC